MLPPAVRDLGDGAAAEIPAALTGDADGVNDIFFRIQMLQNRGGRHAADLVFTGYAAEQQRYAKLFHWVIPLYSSSRMGRGGDSLFLSYSISISIIPQNQAACHTIYSAEKGEWRNPGGPAAGVCSSGQGQKLHRRGPGNTKSQSDRGRGIREERNT